jgi:hypothetical protein
MPVRLYSGKNSKKTKSEMEELEMLSMGTGAMGILKSLLQMDDEK